MKDIKDTLADFGVSFDVFFSEQDCTTPVP
jgi:arginyl-tRNA synthetase